MYLPIHQGIRRCRSVPGFSLVELLVTILIIGAMGAMAMMVLGGGMTDEVEKQRDKRNAQSIANVAMMASAAGAEYFVDGDFEATLTNLKTGCSPDRGPFKGRVFKMPSMDAGALEQAKGYLELNATDLIYNSMGGAAAARP